jgi:tetratricopeptide (TPR) repeat protein
VSSKANEKAKWAEQTELLLRATKNPGLFRFIVVQYNEPDTIGQIDELLRQKHPDRALLRIKSKEEDYHSLIEKIKKHKGFVFIEDFEYLSETPDLSIGFNQRRDLLSTLPVHLLAFVFADRDKANIRAVVDNMRDLWSIRNLTLDFAEDVRIEEKEVLAEKVIDPAQKAEKLRELKRLLEHIEALPVAAENANLLMSYYPQVHSLYLDLGEYDAALKWTDEWKQMLDRVHAPIPVYAQFLSAKSQNLRELGREKDAEKALIESFEIRELAEEVLHHNIVSKSSVETLHTFATHLERWAYYLMDNRASLGAPELHRAKNILKNMRIEISKYLNDRQLQRFNESMDEAEDILDNLIRRTNTKRDESKEFTMEVRTLAKYLRAASSLIG